MSNQLVVENRETGKTTFLLTEVTRLIKDGYNLIIMDSATEHEDKSLLKKVMKCYPTAKLYDARNEQLVQIQHGYENFFNNFGNTFPVKEIINISDNSIICFDLSYFLEKGYDVFNQTNDQQLYNYYRGLYNNLAQQIVSSLIILNNRGIIKNTVVVMDEIEFPIVDFDISSLQKDILFIAAVHPENSFGTFYKSFDRNMFQTFRKV